MEDLHRELLAVTKKFYDLATTSDKVFVRDTSSSHDTILFASRNRVGDLGMLSFEQIVADEQLLKYVLGAFVSCGTKAPWEPKQPTRGFYLFDNVQAKPPTPARPAGNTLEVSLFWLVPPSVRPPSVIVAQLISDLEGRIGKKGMKVRWGEEGKVSTKGPTLFLFATDGRELPTGQMSGLSPLQGSVVLKLEPGHDATYSRIPIDRVWNTLSGLIRVKESVSYSNDRINMTDSKDVLEAVANRLLG